MRQPKGLLLFLVGLVCLVAFPTSSFAGPGGGGLKVCYPFANSQCTTEADYIVVGSGLGGATLMRRLSDDPKYSVIGFETGKYISDDIDIKIGALVNNVYPQYNKYFHTIKSDTNPSKDIISGFGSGGSSSVHGQQYIRISPQFGQLLESKLGPNWSVSAVMNAYKEMENYTVTEGSIASSRGVNGLLNVRKPAAGATSGSGSIANVLANWTSIASGLPITDDYNDASNPARAFGPFPRYQLFQTPEGLRETGLTAFLPSGILRPDGTAVGNRRLRLFYETTVKKVIIENGVAKGVVFEYQGQTYTANARKEIILATHLYTSQLLQLSGVGPAPLLSSLGIPVQVDNDNVGDHFANHLSVTLPYNQSAAQNPDFVNGDFSIYSGGAFLPHWTQAGPLTNLSLLNGERKFQLIWINYFPFYNGLYVGPLQPKSSGYNLIQSTSNTKPPRLNEGTFSDPSDADLFAEFLYYFVQETLFTYMHSQDPNYDIGWTKWNSVADAKEYVKANAGGVAHWCCHARMGTSPDDAVADAEGRVFGVSRLRVSGVAAAPQLPDSGTGAFSAMLGWRIANFIISERDGH